MSVTQIRAVLHCYDLLFAYYFFFFSLQKYHLNPHVTAEVDEEVSEVM